MNRVLCPVVYYTYKTELQLLYVKLRARRGDVALVALDIKEAQNNVVFSCQFQ